MMSHDEMLDGVAAYALGVLPPDEAAAVASHLQTCAECREEYRLLRPAVTAVAYSAETCADADSGAVVASPLLKARVMKEVRAGATRSVTPRRSPAVLVAAACLVLAIVSGLVSLSLSGRVGRDRALIAQQDQTIADLTAPDATHHQFTGGDVLTRGSHLYIAVHGLPVLPPGKVYQAWTLAKGAKTVAPSVTFGPESQGVTVVRLPEAATTLAAVAVSVEPVGGSKQPTTKPIAMVRL
jgi:anti-sigma-K factor RskA